MTSSGGGFIPLCHNSIDWKDTSMESPDEIKTHQRMEMGKQGKVVVGMWSRQMSFKGISSRVEGERLLSGVFVKARERLCDRFTKFR